MMRPAAPWRPRFILPALCRGAPQKRSKTFVLRTIDNESFYVLENRAPAPPKIPRDDELFKISDLLLDLDDMDSKHVRPYTEEDEEQMLKKWEADPAKAKLYMRISEMQTRLDNSRRKAFEIASQPTNAWRVTEHDVLSIALRGIPKSKPSSDSQQMASGNLTVHAALDSGIGSDTLRSICSENGISDYALGNEQLLLHWLRARQRVKNHGPGLPQSWHASPSRDQFIAALKDENSIVSIRRMVSQALSSGLDATWFQDTLRDDSQKPPNTLSNEVRNACVKALDQVQPKEPGYSEVLTFLGSLRQRLSSHDENIGGPLCGLGLRLSACLANPEASFSYLALGFKHRTWAEPEALADVLYALETYSYNLTSAASEAHSMDVSSREILLCMLTGVGDGQDVSVESIRTLALFLMHSLAQADLFKAYIMTLGHLGAVATLWKERQLMRIDNAKELDEFEMDRNFAAAAGAALSVVAQREYAVPADLGLAECATLDMDSIEMRNDDAWSGNSGRSGPITGFQDSAILSAIDLSLDGWLEEVQAAVARSPT
ncbi:hypothetical protein BGZ63DRAFT_411195 [Mariannaea sp. PMI_226]|nr:hypothetical protein BGZ63DRAFT_411195 [Mariannaea sp. PMI_226]